MWLLFFLDLEFLEWEMMLDFYIIGSDIMYKDRWFYINMFGYYEV